MTGSLGFFEDHLGVDAVVAYVDGELSLVAFQRAAAHVQRCPLCAAEVGEQASARESLRTAPAPRIPGSLLESLCSIPLASPVPASQPGIGLDPRGGQAIRVHHVQTQARRRFRLGAGALVVGIAVGAFASTSGSDSPATSDPVTAVPGQSPLNAPIVMTVSGVPSR